MMKVLLITATVLVCLSKQELTEEQHTHIHQIREECTKESGVDPELIERADRGDFADDRSLKCFTKCFYQKVGFLNEQADLQLDVVRSKIPEEANLQRALDVIEKCNEVKADDACEKAYAIHKCYFESSQQARNGGGNGGS